MGIQKRKVKLLVEKMSSQNLILNDRSESTMWDGEKEASKQGGMERATFEGMEGRECQGSPRALMFWNS